MQQSPFPRCIGPLIGQCRSLLWLKIWFQLTNTTGHENRAGQREREKGREFVSVCVCVYARELHGIITANCPEKMTSLPFEACADAMLVELLQGRAFTEQETASDVSAILRKDICFRVCGPGFKVPSLDLGGEM